MFFPRSSITFLCPPLAGVKHESTEPWQPTCRPPGVIANSPPSGDQCANDKREWHCATPFWKRTDLLLRLRCPGKALTLQESDQAQARRKNDVRSWFRHRRTDSIEQPGHARQTLVAHEQAIDRQRVKARTCKVQRSVRSSGGLLSHTGGATAASAIHDITQAELHLSEARKGVRYSNRVISPGHTAAVRQDSRRGVETNR